MEQLIAALLWGLVALAILAIWLMYRLGRLESQTREGFQRTEAALNKKAVKDEQYRREK